MKGIKCIRLKEFSATLLFVFSLASSLALSLGISPSANAASDYDDVISLGTWNTKTTYNDGNCEAFSITQYKEAMRDQARYTPSFQTNYAAVVSLLNTVDSGDAKMLVIQNIVNTTGTGTADSPSFTQGDSFLQVFIGSDEASLKFDDIYGYKRLTSNGYPLTRIDLSQVKTSGGACQMQVTGAFINNPGAYADLAKEANTGALHPRPIFNQIPIVYPSGYEGEFPGNSESNERQIVRPDITWNVADRQVKIKDISSPPAIGPYQVKFIMTVGTFETQTYFYEATLEPGAEETFQVGAYDNASIQAYYVVPGGGKFADTKDYDFRETVVTFEIDGSTFSGSTEGVTCDENDFCVPTEEPEYEDCLAYGADLIGGFQCIVGNVGKFLGNFFKSLFTPDPTFTKQMVDLFTGFTTNTYGLTGVLSAPFSLLSKIQAQTYNCQPVGLPVPYTGGTISLPCMSSIYQQRFGALFTMYQVITTAIISYYVLLGIFIQVKNMKDPENDRIEAHTL